MYTGKLPIIHKIDIDFVDNRIANIVKNSIEPDLNPVNNQICIKYLKVEGTHLLVTIKSYDALVLRKSSNALYEMLILATKAVEEFKD
ncbi:hypothetical protein ACR3K2_12960 [Cryptosporidium serpentis]